MRIDSHVVYSQAHPAEHLAAILKRNRFDAAILVGEFPEATVNLPHIAALVVPAGRLQDYQDHPKLRGVLWRPADGVSVDLAELTRRGLALDLEVGAAPLGLVEQMAGQAPDARIAIDHLARPSFEAPPDAEWLSGIAAVARVPNVFCKVSGLLSGQPVPWSAAPLRPFIRHLLEVFGPGRLMFGSEWPACLPAATWKETLAAFTQAIGAQTMEVREQLLGGTAARFYGLTSHE